ncbi:carbamoyl-phosphate synthase large subunit [Bacillus sp. V3-13]|uniref:carbamoyl phosphate synthase large subunit n=1 Tax=Bacillus sp. V3-13 TaxID=2053728 RepID=UPI000C765789|nr:carbamoyl phosphate synthase large subunit [Bacillus sp. V3-13]PLR78842.1 carbamoyl-phosphate synthase large subunit [Bacillus sp. V3-13]
MPKDTSIQSILLIGSGPIIIGQAAEFDYAGTQACLALKEEGYKVILVNNNPATIMTDHSFADAIYFEPLTADVLEKIIEKERPDGMLATLGGQTGLNLAFQLSENGVLDKYNVRLLGTTIESIKKGEDREAFRELMKELGEPVPESTIVTSSEEALQFASEIGYPIIVRPAYTLGGTGGGIADNPEELVQLTAGGLKESAIGQCLIEKSIAGFKEIEYEVMRDATGTCITICNMENIDPVGIHTGDSIVIAPSQTLTDEEYQMLRSASVKIISSLGIIGGCNIQFALDPESKNYYLIEVNPRVSRSSALASKATGYPIARIAAKLAVGYSLSELKNPVTKDTLASFEPSLDYVVVKIPKWPFDKFPGGNRTLGTQMKATGEVMGIDRNFERAFLKAVQSLEINTIDLKHPEWELKTTDALLESLKTADDERFLVIFELMRRGYDLLKIHEQTKIDLFFLTCFSRMVELEQTIAKTSIDSVTKDSLQIFKEKGFSDKFIAQQWNVAEKDVREKRKSLGIVPAYKMVDTCAAEFEAKSTYFYSSYFGENEQLPSSKQKVLIIGSGPIRIGQGIEFDYCSVHGVFSLKDENIETIMINNNPETVSTDFATADRLYFEPLTVESIMNVIEAEQIAGVIVQLGGQTALNLAKQLEEYGVCLLGTSSETIDILEDRERFYELLASLKIPRIDGEMATSPEEIIEAAKRIGLPILIRPSYVIGGKGMELIQSEEELISYLNNPHIPYPVLVDKFLSAIEAEMDVVADGENILVPAIMEHIEKTGVHSGDSISVLPAQSIDQEAQAKMLSYAKRVVQKLNYKGIMNIQYIIDGERVYLLEINPRASRTVPIVSKATGVQLVQIATKILLGKYSLPSENGLLEHVPFVCVKYPVFSNYALRGIDPKVGPEMKSTGEGISFAENLPAALSKSFHSALKARQEGKAIVFLQGESTEEWLQLAKDAGVKLIQPEDVEKQLKAADTAAFFSTGKSEQARELRELAVRNRVLNFTEKETLSAFLSGLQNKSFTVNKLAEWQEMMKKDVTAV